MNYPDPTVHQLNDKDKFVIYIIRAVSLVLSILLFFLTITITNLPPYFGVLAVPLGWLIFTSILESIHEKWMMITYHTNYIGD